MRMMDERERLRDLSGRLLRLHKILLDRELFNRRIFPCINIPLSGTRKEEKIYDPEELPKIVKLRRALAAVDKVQAMELVLGRLSKFPTNADFLKSF